MNSNRARIHSALFSPLCWKVAISVFLSIIVIEIIVLVPSYLRQEQDLFDHMEQTVRVAFASATSHDDHLIQIEHFSRPSGIFGLKEVKGVSIVEDGKEIAVVGLHPIFSQENLNGTEVFRQKSEDGNSYNFGWRIYPNEEKSPSLYILMDTQNIPKELKAYIFRIFGIVLIVSMFVTITAMLALWLIVLRPIIDLQNRCRDFKNSSQYENLNDNMLQRKDEMGKLYREFQLMMDKINVFAKRTEITTSELEIQVAERTIDLGNANQLLTEQIKKSRHSEQRFQMFAKSAADWYWEMDADLKFSYFSDRFENISGVKPEQLIGKTRQETGMPDIDINQWNEHLACLDNHEAFRNFIHPRTKENGEVVWVSVSGQAVFTDDGVFQGYQGTGLNITDRKNVQDQLEDANLAKSNFLSKMSHELRTPLNAIMGFSELLQTDRDTPLNEEQMVCVGHISTSSSYLLRLINQILDFSAIGSGSFKLECEQVFPKEIFKECLEMLRKMAGEHNITLSGMNESEKGVSADRFRLKQVLVNLMSNAIKYNNEDGFVTFGCKDLPNGNVYLYVTDTGNGISEVMIPMLFKPFERLDYGKSNIEGTGIGLTIAKELVECMGGTIGCESKIGTGTTFWVELPEFHN